MGLTVKQRGLHIATFRFIQVRLMETLAAWVPSTPEMEAKLLFGPHIWDLAQAADALGKRTYELRLPAQHSVAPSPSYLELLERLAATSSAAERMAAFYDVMLPALAARYRCYLMDAPSVRVIEDILSVMGRMIREADALRCEMPALRLNEGELLRQLAAQESSVAELVGDDVADSNPRAA
jgi:hypothetical protein